MKTDLEKLQEAEAEVARLKGELKTAEADYLAEVEKSSKLETERNDLKVKVGELEKNLSAQTEANTTLKTKLEDAQKLSEKSAADLNTADERAETRLREISARNGGTIPGKDVGNLKDFTNADAGKKNLTGFAAVQAAIAEQIGETK